MDDAVTCPNCGAPAPDPYCPACGQPQGRLVPSFREWLKEVLDDLLLVDGTLPRTVGLLLKRPGHLTTEWAAGRRSQYVRPFRLYLATALLFFLIWPLTNPETGMLGDMVQAMNDGFREGYGETDGRDPTASFDLENSVEFGTTTLPRILIIFLVPAFGSLTAMMIRDRDRKYVEHLMFAFHFHAFAFLLLLALLPLELLRSEKVDEVGLYLFAFPLLLYLCIAIGRHYRITKLRAALLGPVILVGYSALFLAAMVAIYLAAPTGPFSGG